MRKCIDFHTHAFPDKLAERAVGSLAANSDPYKPHTDGTIKGLINSMDCSGVTRSVIANIATKIEHFEPIMEWSNSIRSERIEPFISIHPDDPQKAERVKTVKDAGFKGIKLHSMYQDFSIDEKRLYDLYSAAQDLGIIVLFHAGYDIAFGDDRRASVDKIYSLFKQFPRLKIVASHLGGWRAWDEVLELLCGRDIWLETSFIDEVPENLLKRIISKHDSHRLLFGSDSPWLSQKNQIEYIKTLGLNTNSVEKLFFQNANMILYMESLYA